MLAYRHIQYFDFLSPGRVADLYTRHRTLPESLVPDQRALVAAVLCLGRLAELIFEVSPDGAPQRFRPVPNGARREDITYFRLALSHLEQWGAASCTALCKFIPSSLRQLGRQPAPRSATLSCLCNVADTIILSLPVSRSLSSARPPSLARCLPLNLYPRARCVR